MDSDNNRGTVNGPKRLLPNECLRVRYESGTRASAAAAARVRCARANRRSNVFDRPHAKAQ